MQVFGVLLVDERLNQFDLALALPAVGLHDLLEVVDIEEEDVVEVAHLRVDVPGHGDVDEKQGSTAALAHSAFDHVGKDEKARGRRRGDDDIHLGQPGREIVEGDSRTLETARQLDSAFVGAVGDDELPHARVHQILCGELDHLARAEQEDVAVLESIENLSGQFHGGRTDRQPAAADVGLAAGALADLQCSLEHFVDQQARRPRALGDLEAVAHLAEDFRLADDERIDAGGHPKQMQGGLFFGEVVQDSPPPARHPN